MSDISQHTASFRDPAGFIFLHEHTLYRQVNKLYADNYSLLIQSGLYKKLVDKKMLIPHTEIQNNLTNDAQWLVTLQPEHIPFISYPYEWCFDMLKDAALLTLQINMLSIENGMILKDANPFNVQFYKGKPIFIDTLSFEKYDETKPWVAYRQFCELFLYPLLLANYLGYEVQRLLQVYIGGIPVQMVSKMLGRRGLFNLNVLMHVHLPGMVSTKQSAASNAGNFSKKKMLHLLENLQQAVKKTSYHPASSPWQDYYDNTILSKEYLQAKEILVGSFLEKATFETVIDAGANDGFFSRLAAKKAGRVIAFDNDSASINRLYKQCKEESVNNVLPLSIDIFNPPAATGWRNEERASFLERAKADMVLALALLHHLALTNNIPFRSIAAMFSEMGDQLVIEFVPKSDPKAQMLLASRQDIFADYTLASFESAFSDYYNIQEKTIIGSTERVLFLMKKKH